MKTSPAIALAVVLVACGSRTEHAALVAPRPSAAPSAIPSSSATPDASARAEGPPAPVERTGKDWPYHAFGRAEAFAFNPYPEQKAPDDFDVYVYSPRGWNRHIAERKPITMEQAGEAIDPLSSQALVKWNADVARFDAIGLPVDHPAWMSAP